MHFYILVQVKQRLPTANIEELKSWYEVIDSSIGLNIRVLSFSSDLILPLGLFCGKMLKSLHKLKNQALILHLYPRKAMAAMGLGMQIDSHLIQRFQSVLI